MEILERSFANMADAFSNAWNGSCFMIVEDSLLMSISRINYLYWTVTVHAILQSNSKTQNTRRNYVKCRRINYSTGIYICLSLSPRSLFMPKHKHFPKQTRNYKFISVEWHLSHTTAIHACFYSIFPSKPRRVGNKWSTHSEWFE